MTRRMSTTRRAAIFEVVCAHCGERFDRGYPISKSRAAKPQYCSDQCQSDGRAARVEAAVSERFWSKVEKRESDECWPWLGHCRPSGYGWFHLRGRPTNASRAAYLLTHGVELSSDDYVCHSCDNPQCCNPAHLWLGDVAANTRDMDKKGRRVVAVRRGKDHHNARLSADAARQIVRSAKSARELAAQYGVTPAAIYNVRKGKAWAHVTGIRT